MQIKKKSTQYVWPVIGQDKIVEFLDKALRSDSLAQSYLFLGPDYLGKYSLALALAKNIWARDGLELNGDNLASLSDLFILDATNLEASKTSLKDEFAKGSKKVNKLGQIDLAREFSSLLSLSSFLNSYKIGIIKNFDQLNINTQNSLLKILEEPREKVIIILLAKEEEKILKTISSRAQILRFYPVSFDKVYDYLVKDLEVERSLAKKLAAASLGRVLLAKKWIEDKELYQSELALIEESAWLLSLSLNERLAIINKYFPGEINKDFLIKFLNIWESLWRDALLLLLDQKKYLQYPHLVPELEKIPDLSIEKVVDSLKQTTLAKEYLSKSLNPSMIFDNLISSYFNKRFFK